jgi:hypothetical protein
MMAPENDRRHLSLAGPWSHHHFGPVVPVLGIVPTANDRLYSDVC